MTPFLIRSFFPLIEFFFFFQVRWDSMKLKSFDAVESIASLDFKILRWIFRSDISAVAVAAVAAAVNGGMCDASIEVKKKLMLFNQSLLSLSKFFAGSSVLLFPLMLLLLLLSLHPAFRFDPLNFQRDAILCFD